MSSANSVLVLCAGSGVGGMERVVRNLTVELNSRRIHADVILPECEGSENTATWFAEAGIAANRSPALTHGFGKRRLSGIPRLAVLIRSFPAGVVNIHYGMNFASLNDVLAARLAGKRCVVSLHAGGGSDPLPKRTRRLKNEFTARFCSAVVAVSSFQGREIGKHGTEAGKIIVIPSGIPAPVRDLPNRDQLRERFGVPATAFAVVTAARLGKPKGIAELITAVAGMPTDARLQRNHGVPYLLIAGEGPERGALEDLASRLLPGRHRFLGFVSGMSELYSAADLFVLPSHEESFGLVYAEAQLHGLPVIGTTVGGVPDTVGDDLTASLVPPRDPDALREAIVSLWEDRERRETMALLGKIRAERNFSMKAMADGYLRVLFPAGSR